MQKKTAPSLPKKKKVQISQTPTGEAKGVVHNGKLLDLRSSSGILEEANRLSNSQLLLDLISDVESTATEMIYFKAQDIQQLQFGKGMLNSLEILNKKIINLSKTTIKK